MIKADDRALERRINFWAGVAGGFIAGALLGPVLAGIIEVVKWLAKIFLACIVL